MSWQPKIIHFGTICSCAHGYIKTSGILFHKIHQKAFGAIQINVSGIIIFNILRLYCITIGIGIGKWQGEIKLLPLKCTSFVFKILWWFYIYSTELKVIPSSWKLFNINILFSCTLFTVSFIVLVSLFLWTFQKRVLNCIFPFNQTSPWLTGSSLQTPGPQTPCLQPAGRPCRTPGAAETLCEGEAGLWEPAPRAGAPVPAMLHGHGHDHQRGATCVELGCTSPVPWQVVFTSHLETHLEASS